MQRHASFYEEPPSGRHPPTSNLRHESAARRAKSCKVFSSINLSRVFVVVTPALAFFFRNFFSPHSGPFPNRRC